MSPKSLIPRRPKSAWGKSLKADKKGLFVSLAKGLGHGLSGRWSELTADTAGVLTSLGLETTPEERAWLLLHRGMVRAVNDLLRDYQNILSAATVPAELSQDLDSKLDGSKLSLDNTFFSEPGDNHFVTITTELLGLWLEAVGLTMAEGGAVAASLRTYFVYAVAAEWRESPTFYLPIAQALDNPLDQATKREHQWILYDAFLQKQMDTPIFEESFSLSQIYVPIRAHHGGKREGFLSRHTSNATREVVVDLADYIESWISADDPKDTIRVISGGPGAGKSSFCKFFSAYWRRPRKRLLYVQAFNLDISRGLRNALEDYSRRTGLFPENSLTPRTSGPSLVLILDGLDEISLKGRIGPEAVRNCLNDIDRIARDLNTEGTSLQIIATARELTVQSAEADIRRMGHVVTMLPYYVDPKDRRKYDDPDGLLSRDQRKIWWKRFSAATMPKVAPLPSLYLQHGLSDLTSQPLLCCLLAMIYSRKEPSETYSKKTTPGRYEKEGTPLSRIVIFGEIFSHIYERSYDARRHKSIGALSREQFMELLEEIGLAAWHGGSRLVTVSVLEQYCKGSPRLTSIFEHFRRDIREGISGLLAAFYFRQEGVAASGEPAFAFIHRSFGEYLAARRLIRALDMIVNRLGPTEDYSVDWWDEDECLRRWTSVSGAASVDGDLLQFVREEIFRRETAEVYMWQGSISRLLSRVLAVGLPIESIRSLRFKILQNEANNAVTSLYVVMNSCARLTAKINRVRWPDRVAFGSWLKTAQGQRSGKDNPVIMRSLSLLDLSELHLEMADLYGANLERSELTGASLFGSTLQQARLSRANLCQANLGKADLFGANLDGAKLEKASMAYADVRQANLRLADLSKSNLDFANLSGAILSQTNLRNSSLRHTNLTGVDLRKADLSHSILDSSSLRDADLRGANLRGASLIGADLTDADLRKCKFTEEQLDTANLKRTRFSDTPECG